MSPMFGKQKVFVPVILLIVLMTVGGRAQSEHQGQISLKVAIERAFENDPVLRSASKGREVASAGLSEARASWFPSLRFNQSFTRSDNPVFVFGSLLEQGRFGASNFAVESLNQPSPLTNSRSILNAQLTIFDQWNRGARIKKAEIGRDAARLEEEALKQRTVFEVVRSYYGLILAKERVRVSEDSLRSAQENLRRAKDMSELGRITDADSLAAEVEVAMAEQRLLESRGGERIALADLNVRIGNKNLVELVPISDLTERFFPIDESADLVSIAFDNRPDWKTALYSVESSEADLRSAKGAWLPRVDAFANYGYSSPMEGKGSSDYTYGVSLTYDIFDAGRTARTSQASGAKAIAEARLDAERNRIRLEVIKAEQNFKTARARVQVLVKSADQAAEVLRISRDRYQNGLTTLTDVLRAEAALSNARQETLSARHDYLVAHSALLMATGRLTLEGVVD